MFGDFQSPRFESMGCFGAIVCVVLIVAAVFALLYVPWSILIWE